MTAILLNIPSNSKKIHSLRAAKPQKKQLARNYSSAATIKNSPTGNQEFAYQSGIRLTFLPRRKVECQIRPNNRKPKRRILNPMGSHEQPEMIQTTRLYFTLYILSMF
ncbi:hypothetical protein NPIL_668281 [Nephila pilipes]|uniref:Uncharacterized protein n=1 Tax=Nephila pilipes TaxID=299642 RepID=A0A8X6NML1_NEPPI|nr:hypothetical protein NPIL_668281 [Nephila pilipes]